MEKNKNKDNEEKAIIFRIITLGDSGVGKSSIIKKYLTGVFEENNSSTVGINFSFKELIINKSQKIKLKIIDTCGQEKFRSLSKTYFKNADGVLFVFGINDKESFDNIKEWMGYFNEHKTIENTPKVLVGNKCDLEIDKI
jgi:small GTP-binding protein